MAFRFLTAGESHGPGLTIIVEGVPAGVPLLAEQIDQELAARQGGYGRGARMKIETDRVRLTGGVRHGLTLGSPIGMSIDNRDHANWQEVMSPHPVDASADPELSRKLADKRVTRVRPGHADFPGAIKYRHDDVRNVLERSSARETTSRVAAGAVAQRLLSELGVSIRSRVVRIGPVAAEDDGSASLGQDDWQRAAESPVGCHDPQVGQRMIDAIDASRKAGETLGGVVEIVAWGVPIGIGSHVHWDLRLDGLLAQALMSVHTVKSVSLGLGEMAGELPGSQVHDEIFRNPQDPPGYSHFTNRAGGIEGGMSNGEPMVCRAILKPIPTLARRPESSLRAVDLETRSDTVAFYERSDVCVVPAGGVVCRAMVACVLAERMLAKFGGDALAETQQNLRNYLDYCRSR